MKLNFNDVVDSLDAKRQGENWIAKCPSHDDNTPSLSLKEGVNGFTLLNCFAGCSQKEVWSRIKEIVQTEPQRAQIKKTNNSSFKDSTWAAAKPIDREYESAANRYFEKRGLEIPLKADNIRYCDSLFYDQNIKTPAILFRIDSQTKNFIGLQRIYLDENGNKASVPSPKKVLGECKNGFISFGTKTNEVHLAEGPETALAIYQTLKKYTLSLINANGVKFYEPPIEIKTVHIWADRDESTVGQEAAAFLAAKLVKKGIQVFIHEPQLHSLKSCDWLDVLNQLSSQNILDSYIKCEQRNRLETLGFPVVKCLEKMLEEPDVNIEYIVEDLLITGGISVLSAKPKVGKSTTARQIAASVSAGIDVFGRKTIQGTVIYLALEEIESQVKNHFRLMGIAENRNLSIYCGAAPSNPNNWLIEIITQYQPSLIIIDPLLRFLKSKDCNSYSEISNSFNPIIEIARKTNTHLMFIHHSRKGAGGNGGDDILGSTAIFSSVDTSISMKKDKDGRIIESINRYGKSIDESYLSFNENTMTVDIRGTKVDISNQKLSDDILEFLKISQSTKTEEEIRVNVTGRTGSFREALRKLRDSNMILREGAGTKNNPFLYYFKRNARSDL